MMVSQNTDYTIKLVEEFELIFGTAGMRELDAVSIVSNHDKSIRFTNSTTSVMKPFLMTPSLIPKPGIFLIQPAVGMQGVEYWLNNRKFGRFSSFFLSYGALFPIENASLCCNLVAKFLKLYFSFNALTFSIHTGHMDKMEGIHNLLPVEKISERPETDYMHRYGMPGYVGYDIIVETSLNEKHYGFGSITVIWNEYMPIAIEFSVDSTLLLSAMNYSHSVLCLPAFDAAKIVSITLINDCALPFLDFSELICMLCIDGLRLGSRGRPGNLKKVFKELLRLSFELRINERDMFQYLEELLLLDYKILQNIRYFPIDRTNEILVHLHTFYAKYKLL